MMLFVVLSIALPALGHRVIPEREFFATSDGQLKMSNLPSDIDHTDKDASLNALGANHVQKNQSQTLETASPCKYTNATEPTETTPIHSLAEVAEAEAKQSDGQGAHAIRAPSVELQISEVPEADVFDPTKKEVDVFDTLSSMTVGSTAFVLSVFGLGFLLLIGNTLLVHSPWLRSIHAPACLVGGLAGFAALTILKFCSKRAHTFILSECLAGWNEIPSFLICVVFAGVVLGEEIPSPVAAWKLAGDHILYGLAVGFGQYTICSILTIALFTPIWGTTPYFAVILPFGLIGGHGTCAGMRTSLEEVGYKEGFSLGMATSSIALLVGVLLGSWLVNWAAARNLLTSHASPAAEVADNSEDKTDVQTSPDRWHKLRAKLYTPEDAPSFGKKVSADEHMDTLAYHVAYLSMALGSAGIIRITLMMMNPMMCKIPLFPFCLITSMLLQILCDKVGIHLDRATVNRIVNTAQDCIIVSGIALLSLDELADAGLMLIIGLVLVMGWSLFAFGVLSRFMLKDFWVERGLVELGASIGNTSTGLLLLRMADPEQKTPILKIFGLKQLVACPLIGGGVFDALTLMMISASPWVYLGVCSSCLSACLLLSVINRKLTS